MGGAPPRPAATPTGGWGRGTPREEVNSVERMSVSEAMFYIVGSVMIVLIVLAVLGDAVATFVL